MSCIRHSLLVRYLPIHPRSLIALSVSVRAYIFRFALARGCSHVSTHASVRASVRTYTCASRPQHKHTTTRKYVRACTRIHEGVHANPPPSWFPRSYGKRTHLLIACRRWAFSISKRSASSSTSHLTCACLCVRLWIDDAKQALI